MDTTTSQIKLAKAEPVRCKVCSKQLTASDVEQGHTHCQFHGPPGPSDWELTNADCCSCDGKLSAHDLEHEYGQCAKCRSPKGKVAELLVALETGQTSPIVGLDSILTLLSETGLWKEDDDHAANQRRLTGWLRETEGVIDPLLLPIEELLERLWGKRDGVNGKAPEATAVSAPQPKATVNARMLDLLSKQPAAADWPARRWEYEMGCVHSVIIEQPAWKSIMDARKVRKNNRLAIGSDKRRNGGQFVNKNDQGRE